MQGVRKQSKQNEAPKAPNGGAKKQTKRKVEQFLQGSKNKWNVCQFIIDK